MTVNAVIGGTGFTQFETLTVADKKMLKTPFGETSGLLELLESSTGQVAFLPRHGHPHRIPPHKVNYRANIWALKQIGIKRIIAVNAVGGITPPMQAGVICIPDQIIDYTYGREHTFYDGTNDTLDHVDFTFPYSAYLRVALQDAAEKLGIAIIPNGIYAATQGPRLESIGEINKLERDGCDIVGMTGMPEAGLARELGLDYACISLVVNPAAGKSDALITMEDIKRVLDSGMGQVRQIVIQALTSL